MQTCTVYADMSAGRAPTITLCDDCVQADRTKKGDSQILTTDDYDSDFGESCEWCGAKASEEKGG